MKEFLFQGCEAFLKTLNLANGTQSLHVIPFTKSSIFIDHHEEILLELWLDLLPSRVMLMMFSVRFSTS